MITRRELIERAGAAGVLLAAGGIWPARAAAALPTPQPGIATPPAAKLDFAAVDLIPADAGVLRELLKTWTAVAARATRSSASSRLSVTFGFGPSLFGERLGLEELRPRQLEPLPFFPGDQLDIASCGGDLGIQACSDDPGVAREAIDELLAAGASAVRLHWRQTGYGRAAKTTRRPRTPRNLLGFKDGTANIDAANRRQMKGFVWATGPGWMAGGTYLVARRIRMLLPEWRADSRLEQERVIGRRKASGAPIGGHRESDTPDFNARDRRGHLLIPADAHVRLASPGMNGGTRILRRGYSYDNGTNAYGQRDAGLFFISFQRDPRQFIAIQRTLTERDDALLEYVVHESSAIFACPPAPRPGGYIGDGLL